MTEETMKEEHYEAGCREIVTTVEDWTFTPTYKCSRSQDDITRKT